jgi:tripartite-type tricarboxylate transporter receptor subunit TctC
VVPTSLTFPGDLRMLRQVFRRLAAAGAAFSLPVLWLLPLSAVAQQPWPAKPITIINGFPAGAGTDIVLRMFQEPLERDLGTQLVFDYKPGAGGNVGSEYVAKAQPDGYTLMIATAGTHGINAALYKKLPFDVEADFTPIAPLADVPNVLTINPSLIDVKTVTDFIAAVKAAPGKFNYGSTGNGASTHLGFAQFNAAAGLDMVHVPYKGSPEAVQAMLTGETCCLFAQVQTVLGQWRAGKVRLLGVSTTSRVGILADVPTIDEAGIPRFQNVTWYGLVGPKGLDAKIAERINAAVRKAQENPALREKLIGIGTASRSESVEAFRATLKADRGKWAEIVKTSGAKID